MIDDKAIRNAVNQRAAAITILQMTKTGTCDVTAAVNQAVREVTDALSSYHTILNCLQVKVDSDKKKAGDWPGDRLLPG